MEIRGFSALDPSYPSTLPLNTVHPSMLPQFVRSRRNEKNHGGHGETTKHKEKTERVLSVHGVLHLRHCFLAENSVSNHGSLKFGKLVHFVDVLILRLCAFINMELNSDYV